ncbi:MAG: lipopolysaccharide biosynthesis protein [Hyphomicrobiaceae bacterium]
MTSSAQPVHHLLAGKIVKGAIWSALESWGQHAVMFAIFIVLARLLGPEALGLALLALSFPLIISAALTKGFSDSLVQRTALSNEHQDSIFWLLLGTGSLAALALSLASGLIAASFGHAELASLVRWASLLIFFTCAATVPAATLRRDLAFRTLAMRTLTGTLAGGGMGCVMAYADYGAWSIVTMQLARCAVEAAYLLLASSWQPRLRFSASRCRELTPFALPLSLSTAWNSLNDELPKLFLGGFLGPVQVGLYSLARRPLEFLTSALLSPISSVTMPAVARMQGDVRRIEIYYANAIRIAAIAGFPAFAGLAVIAPDLVPLVLGDKWTGSITAVQIIMMLGLIRCVDSIAYGLVLAHGHSVTIVCFNVAYTVTITILLLFASRIGLEAALFAIILANLAVLPAFLIVAKRQTGINVLGPLARLPRIALASAIMVGAVLAWRSLWAPSPSEPLFILSAIAVGALAYVAAAFSLLKSDIDETRELLARALPSWSGVLGSRK